MKGLLLEMEKAERGCALFPATRCPRLPLGCRGVEGADGDDGGAGSGCGLSAAARAGTPAAGAVPAQHPAPMPCAKGAETPLRFYSEQKPLLNGEDGPFAIFSTGPRHSG